MTLSALLASLHHQTGYAFDDRLLISLLLALKSNSRNLILRLGDEQELLDAQESLDYTTRVAQELRWMGQTIFGSTTHIVRCTAKMSASRFNRAMLVSSTAISADAIEGGDEDIRPTRARSGSWKRHQDSTRIPSPPLERRRSGTLSSLLGQPDYTVPTFGFNTPDVDDSSAGEDLFPRSSSTTPSQISDRRKSPPPRRATLPRRTSITSTSNQPHRSSSFSSQPPQLARLQISSTASPTGVLSVSPVSLHTRNIAHGKSFSSGSSSTSPSTQIDSSQLPQILILEQFGELRPSVQQGILELLSDRRVKIRSEDGKREEVVALPGGFIIVAIVTRSESSSASNKGSRNDWNNISRYLLDQFTLSHTYPSRTFRYPSLSFASTLPLNLSRSLTPALLSPAPLSTLAISRVYFSPAAENFLNDLLSTMRLTPEWLEGRMMTARGGRELERLIKVWCTISKGTHLGLLGQEGEGDGEEEDEVGVKDILSVLMSGVEHRLRAVKEGHDVATIVRRIVREV